MAGEITYEGETLKRNRRNLYPRVAIKTQQLGLLFDTELVNIYAKQKSNSTFSVTF